MWAKPIAFIIYHSHAIECGATKIRHTCGNCATIFLGVVDHPDSSSSISKTRSSTIRARRSGGIGIAFAAPTKLPRQRNSFTGTPPRLEFIRVLTTCRTHKTPSCSKWSLPKVSTVSEEGQRAPGRSGSPYNPYPSHWGRKPAAAWSRGPPDHSCRYRSTIDISVAPRNRAGPPRFRYRFWALKLRPSK